MHLNYLNLTKFELFNKVPVEECIDELQETPFLVDTEQCEDVPKLVCTEVSFDISIHINPNISTNLPLH